MTNKLDVRKDWTHKFPCGCQVTYQGNSLHKSRRFLGCDSHSGKDQTDLRTRMMEEAAGHYEPAQCGTQTKYADIADLGEDDRIQKIGKAAMDGNLVAFIVEDETKATRYCVKLLANFPDVAIVESGPGPIKDSIAVKVCRKDTLDIKGVLQTNIKIVRVGDPAPFHELADKKFHDCRLDRVVLLEKGTTSGRSSVILLIDMPDGSVVQVETTARLFDGIAAALRGGCASWGEDVTK